MMHIDEIKILEATIVRWVKGNQYRHHLAETQASGATPLSLFRGQQLWTGYQFPQYALSPFSFLS